MQYVSTRGGVTGLRFCDAVMMGLATDGGLLLPEQVPDVSAELGDYPGLSYEALAGRLMRHFIDDIPESALADLIHRSYATFDAPDVAPLVQVGDLWVQELFHGPTYAFKDVALQFLGRLFEHILETRGETLNILGATSGDTGSAAIAGVRGSERINIFTMYPKGRTSLLQERQMTTVLDANVINVAIEGSFDDCQSILKTVFSDLEFKARHRLGAVNSVNWARVLAQVVYYFFAYVQLGSPERFQVAVPTGNFGNVFAGYLARRMGLPIHNLILATNRNDILHRFFTTGRYERGDVHHSLSPAMDIQVASNFERYLYYLFARDPQRVTDFLSDFAKKGVATVNAADDKADVPFLSGCADDDETLGTIRRVYEAHGYVLDPHTAVAVSVAEALREPDVPLVCLATAHPGKFDEAIVQAIPAGTPEFRLEPLEALRDAPERKVTLPVDAEQVKALIRDQS